MLANINTILYGLEDEYQEFIRLYGSDIYDLWSKQYNREDNTGRSTKRYTINQYILALYVSYLIKLEYKSGLIEENLPSIYDINSIRDILICNGMDLDNILNGICSPQKLFSLGVNSDQDEVADLVRSRTVSQTNLQVTTDSGIYVYQPTSTVALEIDEQLEELNFIHNYSNSSFTIRIVFKKTADTIAITKHNSDATNREFLFKQDNTDRYLEVSDKNYNLLLGGFTSTTTTGSWEHLVCSYSGTDDAQSIKFYCNGKLYSEASTSLVYAAPSIKNTLNMDITGTPNILTIDLFKGEMSEKDAIADYLYYKNLLNI